MKLLKLFETAAMTGDRLEKAIRLWAVTDTRAAEEIVRVDQRRLTYLQTLFQQLGFFSKKNALIRAQVAYSVRLGWFLMAGDRSRTERLTQIRLVHTMLTQPNPDSAMHR